MKMSLAFQYQNVFSNKESFHRVVENTGLVVDDPDTDVRKFLESNPVIGKVVPEVVKDLAPRFGKGRIDSVIRGTDNSSYLCIRIYVDDLSTDQAEDILLERLEAYAETCIGERLGNTSIVVFGNS